MTRRGFVTRRDCPGDWRRRTGGAEQAGPRGDRVCGARARGRLRRLVFDQIDSSQAAAFGQAFEAILAALEDDGGPLSRPVPARRRAHRDTAGRLDLAANVSRHGLSDRVPGLLVHPITGLIVASKLNRRADLVLA